MNYLFIILFCLCLLENHLDVDALAGVEILIPNGEMSPNKLGNGQVPSISYSSVQSLGVGDPISHVKACSFLIFGNF